MWVGGGECWECAGEGAGRQRFISAVTYILEPACSRIRNCYYSTMLPSQTDTKRSITVITILLKICPVGFTCKTWSLWNFSDSILSKEIMVWKTKTINRYWRALFPEWFPTGKHRTRKPAVNSQAQGSTSNAQDACFQKGIRLLLREFLFFFFFSRVPKAKSRRKRRKSID